MFYLNYQRQILFLASLLFKYIRFLVFNIYLKVSLKKGVFWAKLFSTIQGITSHIFNISMGIGMLYNTFRMLNYSLKNCQAFRLSYTIPSDCFIKNENQSVKIYYYLMMTYFNQHEAKVNDFFYLKQRKVSIFENRMFIFRIKNFLMHVVFRRYFDQILFL